MDKNEKTATKSLNFVSFWELRCKAVAERREKRIHAVKPEISDRRYYVIDPD